VHEAAVLAAKLRQDGDRLNAYLGSLQETERTAQVYTEDTVWTVRSVLAHLVSAESGFLELFREIQQGGVGVREGFAIDSFNAAEQIRNRQMTWDELLQSFGKNRTRLVDFVASLTPDDLERVGRHPFLGVTSLREMVKLIYIHAQTHLRDVRRALTAH
jgi:uncharacterized damage-inducible protein DinB